MNSRGKYLAEQFDVTDSSKTISHNMPAVCVQKLYKSHQNKHFVSVIQDFCMSVTKGTIYSLLGASGSGKTTLLSCIVGLSNWDSGSILVFGETPGTSTSGVPGKTIGYMPQELALYNHLNSKETIYLICRLYSLSNSETKHRYDFLKNLLELSFTKHRIADISGGQKRRVALALALVHSPKLLVLDEPTVGLDPLLRQKIWKYLCTIVESSKTTVLITTHYYEEAKLSNMVGILRNGRLIAEQRPQELLETYHSHNLQDAVMKLCRENEKNPESFVETNEGFRKRKEKSEVKIRATLNINSPMASLQKIWELSKVLLLELLRIPAFISFALFLPTLNICVLLLTFGCTVRNLHIGVVNLEVIDWKNGCNWQNSSQNDIRDSYLSCQYIDILNRTELLSVDLYESEIEARMQVLHGNSWGYLNFPPNYTKHLLHYFVESHFSTNETLAGYQIHASLDFSESFAAFLVVKRIYETLLEHLKQSVAGCNISESEFDLPLLYRKPVYGSYEDDYVSFIVPGVVIITILTTVLASGAYVYYYDREQGTLKRLVATGLTNFEIYFSHVFTQIVFSQTQIAVISLVLQFGFSSLTGVSVWLYYLICSLIGIYAASLGVLIGIVGKTPSQIFVMGLFHFFLTFHFADVVFPSPAMSKMWQRFGNIMPAKLPTQALRSVMLRKVEITHRQVWPGIASILGFTFLVLLTALKAQKHLRSKL